MLYQFKHIDKRIIGTCDDNAYDISFECSSCFTAVRSLVLDKNNSHKVSELGHGWNRCVNLCKFPVVKCYNGKRFRRGVRTK